MSRTHESRRKAERERHELLEARKSWPGNNYVCFYKRRESAKGWWLTCTTMAYNILSTYNGKKQSDSKVLHILFINACFITKKQKKQTRNEREEEECLYLHYGRLKIYTSYTGMRSSIRTRHIGHFLHFSQHVLQTTSTRHNKNLQHERNSRKQMVSNKQVNIKS